MLMGESKLFQLPVDFKTAAGVGGEGEVVGRAQGQETGYYPVLPVPVTPALTPTKGLNPAKQCLVCAPGQALPRAQFW